MKKNTANLFRLLPALTWGLIILVLSLAPAPPTFDLMVFSWDKFQHASAYALLTLLAGFASQPHFRRLVAWLLAFTTAVIYGGLMEIVQGTLSTVRTPEWGDLAADAVGAAVALFLVWVTTLVIARPFERR